jgi:hypothetical protein
MLSFFMLHESPQQQHDSLSDDEAWFFMLSFFMLHESPQQQHDSLSPLAWFFMPSCFVMSHESPQQPPDVQQHEAFLSPPDCVAFCANAAPASTSINPSARAGTYCLRHFIFYFS